MTDNANGGSNSGLYFVVGGLVVAVGLCVFVYAGGYIGGHSSKTTTEQTSSAPAPARTTTTTTTEQTKTTP